MTGNWYHFLYEYINKGIYKKQTITFLWPDNTSSNEIRTLNIMKDFFFYNSNFFCSTKKFIFCHYPVLFWTLYKDTVNSCRVGHKLSVLKVCFHKVWWQWIKQRYILETECLSRAPTSGQSTRLSVQ